MQLRIKLHDLPWAQERTDYFHNKNGARSFGISNKGERLGDSLHLLGTPESLQT